MLYEPRYINANPSRNYSDLDLAFVPNPINKDVAKKYDVDAIKQAVKVLVLLNHYEKAFHPDIGCDIYRTLFENIELPGTKEQMIEFITHVITTYEPRADLTEVVVEPDPDNNGVRIAVWFIPENAIEPVSVEIFLKVLR